MLGASLAVHVHRQPAGFHSWASANAKQLHLTNVSAGVMILSTDET